ncbi:ATP-binding cassette domain-containing protein [Gordonia phosphorivorans]|uniref:ATP-binding cassette domain-containing protein n=1 Tax=Gordonia phosphorivorans TaxID=1056982 RepID=A0ABV6H7J4_9ACTN
MAVSCEQLVVGHHQAPVAGPITVTVSPGRVCGLIGPSGAGKTTLLRTLAGLNRPISGTVHRSGAVGVLAQHPRQVANPRWTLRKIISEPARIGGTVADVDTAAATAGLERALLDRFPGQVSDGQLQRACVARLLVQNPPIILCDEPVAMLDPIASGVVIEAVEELSVAGAAVVLASHHQQLVRRRADLVIDLGVAATGR